MVRELLARTSPLTTWSRVTTYCHSLFPLVQQEQRCARPTPGACATPSAWLSSVALVHDGVAVVELVGNVVTFHLPIQAFEMAFVDVDSDFAPHGAFRLLAHAPTTLVTVA